MKQFFVQFMNDKEFFMKIMDPIWWIFCYLFMVISILVILVLFCSLGERFFPKPLTAPAIRVTLGESRR